LPTLPIIHAIAGASSSSTSDTRQLVQNMIARVAAMLNALLTITLSASTAACATCSLSIPSRVSIDGTGSLSKRVPGRCRYLSISCMRRSRATPRPERAMA